MHTPLRNKRTTGFKRYCASLILFAVISSSLAIAQVKIDVKTSLKHKEEARLAKAGLVAYLKQSEWAEVVNFGEQYAVWIENYHYKIRGNDIRFELDLELRTKVEIGSGKLLKTSHVVDTVDMAEVAELKTFEARELNRIVAKQLTKSGKLKGLTSALGTAASTQGVPGVSAVLETGLKYFGLDLNAEYTADEAIIGMVLGSTLIVELRSMIDEIENVDKNSDKEPGEED